jgi:hypothetical protein
VILLVTLMVGICGMPAFAQKFEVNPYAGGLFMSDFNSNLQFKNPALFGVKSGAYITQNVMLQGNVGWMNQFNFGGFDDNTSGILYDVLGTYNFCQVRVRGMMPYVKLGVGGWTIRVDNHHNFNDPHKAVYTFPLATPQPTAGPIPNTLGVLVTSNNDTFFTISYGGGVKGERLWGPLGYTVDIGGRTMPNFFGTAINSFEATGGVLLSWGER